VAAEIDKNADTVYEAVSLREFWGFLSLASFLASLATRWTVRILPRELQGWDRIPPNAVLLVPAFAALGLLFAWIAGRKATITGRVGFLLNAVVLGISAVLLLLIVAWRLSR
jgi:hypothetical protein